MQVAKYFNTDGLIKTTNPNRLIATITYELFYIIVYAYIIGGIK